MTTKLSRAETAALRELASEAWELELHGALEELYENFGRWADNGYSSGELTERIHQFHNGISRELYQRYTGLPPLVAVARAVATGVMDKAALPSSLQEKIADEIEAQRRILDTD